MNGINSRFAPIRCGKGALADFTMGIELVGQLNTGGELNLVAMGAGEDSRITVAGSDIFGQGGTRLYAEGDILLQAFQGQNIEHSQNKSSSWNAGAAITYGNGGVAFGVTAGGCPVAAGSMERDCGENLWQRTLRLPSRVMYRICPTRKRGSICLPAVSRNHHVRRPHPEAARHERFLQVR